MSETDTVLVSRGAEGDRAAFEELVRRTSRLVFAPLFDTGRIDRADDLLQETFLLAFRSLRGLANLSGFRPWLLAIAHNVLIDDARRLARQSGPRRPRLRPSRPCWRRGHRPMRPWSATNCDVRPRGAAITAGRVSPALNAARPDRRGIRHDR